MLEIEQKFADADFPFIEGRMKAWNAAGPTAHDEADHYFNAPDRDFARTDEAFRLRRAGARNFLTYKGPKRQAEVKIRTELEIPLPEGDEAARRHTDLLVHLGYRPVAVVRKHRRSYSLDRGGFPVTVCLDEVEGLGRFAEVELLAEDGQTRQATETIGQLAGELRLTRVVRRSYLGLLLASRAAGGHQGSPQVVTEVAALRQALAEARRQGKTVGLVPTMGALHEGHLALIRAARADNEFVAVSVFVNPTQFGPNEDLSRYPRPFDEDVRLCAAAGVDLIFHPAPEAMYPSGFCTQVEVTGLQDVLEGASRPGHFRGVATVVLKLLNLVQPDRAYFGQKDAQQARVVCQMVKDLNVPVDIRIHPTVREPDGLALSSRNRYLDPVQRSQAVILHQALTEARDLYRAGERDPARLQQAVVQRISSVSGAQLDYAAAVAADTLSPLDRLTDEPVLLALAVRFGATRLIDNLILPDA